MGHPEGHPWPKSDDKGILKGILCPRPVVLGHLEGHLEGESLAQERWWGHPEGHLEGHPWRKIDDMGHHEGHHWPKNDARGMMKAS